MSSSISQWATKSKGDWGIPSKQIRSLWETHIDRDFFSLCADGSKMGNGKQVCGDIRSHQGGGEIKGPTSEKSFPILVQTRAAELLPSREESI